MLGLPLWWHLSVDRKSVVVAGSNGGYGAATAIGLVFAFVMVLAWLFIGESRLDRQTFLATLEPFGLTDVNTYIAAAVFWTVEIRCWRNTCFVGSSLRKARLFGPGMADYLRLRSHVRRSPFLSLWFLGFSYGEPLGLPWPLRWGRRL